MPGKYDHFHQTYESLVVLILKQIRTMLVYIPFEGHWYLQFGLIH